MYFCTMKIEYEIDQINDIATQVFLENKEFKMWKFYGNMGAGKTTFIKALKNELQIIENVISPTFTIINKYSTKNGLNILHIDLYRIDNPNELIEIGLEDEIENCHYCFIEWAEKLPNYLNFNGIELHFENNRSINDKKRILFIKK